MNVNGVTSGVAGYSTYTSQAKANDETTTNVSQVNTAEEKNGVVYEPSTEAATTAGTGNKTYKTDINLVNKLKADAEAKTEQLRSIVEKLITGQGNTLGTADDMWSFLRSGDFTVDAATKAQAQEDISEDGYWGVKQTSDRIIDFATALTGGDPEKMEKMREAFKQGFEQATKTWGDKLPDISQQTYDAVMKKFDDYAASFESPEKE